MICRASGRAFPSGIDISFPDSTPSASHFFKSAAAPSLPGFSLILFAALRGDAFACLTGLALDLAGAFFFFTTGRLGLTVFVSTLLTA